MLRIDGFFFDICVGEDCLTVSEVDVKFGFTVIFRYLDLVEPQTERLHKFRKCKPHPFFEGTSRVNPSLMEMDVFAMTSKRRSSAYPPPPRLQREHSIPIKEVVPNFIIHVIFPNRGIGSKIAGWEGRPDVTLAKQQEPHFVQNNDDDGTFKQAKVSGGRGVFS